MTHKPYFWHFSAMLLALVAGQANATSLPRQSSAPESCIVPNGWLEPGAAKSRSIAAPKLLASVAERDFVLLGEQHDNPDHHRWQLQTLAGLHAYRTDMVIGFEMFPRRLQPVLDRWVAGKLSVREFLTQAEWDTVWTFPPELYLPLFEFARINRIPMLALNVDRSLIKAIGEKGWDRVSASERADLGRPAPASVAYRDLLLGIYSAHAPTARRSTAKIGPADKGFESFVDAQLTWDRAMAEVLASRAGPVKHGRKPLVVGVMGSGHLRFGHGVPHQLRALGFSQIATLLPKSDDANCDDLTPGLADAVFALPAAATAPVLPPRLGVALEDADGTVRIQSITPGSLAERSGILAGDRLIEIAGSPPLNTAAVIAMIRRQPPGTWLPLRVQRGSTAVDLVVRFPVRP